MIQSSVNSFGATIVAGNSAAQNIEGFVYVAMNAFSQAVVAFVSQNMGAGKFERINKVVITSQFCVIAVGLILGIGAYLLGEPLLHLYTDSELVVEAGMNRLAIISVTYALCGMMDCMVGALRGLGCSITPMIVSLIGVCVLRIAWIFVFFQIERYHTIGTVYYAYPITWTVTFIAHTICFLIIRRKMKKAWGV